NVLRGPKIGFDIPVHDWLRGVCQPMLMETLSEKNIRATRLFRWSAVERLIGDHMERRANLGYHLWGLMVLLFWMKQWNIALGSKELSLDEAIPASLDQVGSL